MQPGLMPVDDFDMVIVDEAWMASAEVWPTMKRPARQVLPIGDPG